MGLKVALMTRHHATLICEEARKLLLDAGFEIISNDTGRILTREDQKAHHRGYGQGAVSGNTGHAVY